MIDISGRRECFFDDFLIDKEKTTARRRLHKPERREIIFTLDAPWESNLSTMFTVIFAQGLWRMYYVVFRPGETYFCYAESKDGYNWVRPNLGLIEFEGSTDNNIIFNREAVKKFDFLSLDNLSVFYDDTPDCPKDERYKMTCMWIGHESLLLLMSEDGIHFTKSRFITNEGEFDSQNRMFYSHYHKKYFCYFRGEHKPGEVSYPMDRSYADAEARKNYDPVRRLQHEPGKATTSFLRDIRVIESQDGINWSHAEKIYTTGRDFQLYHNVIFPYPRAPHLFVGIPSRYVERKRWDDSYEVLCGKEDRLKRMETLARFGLSITDSLFMSSRDGYNFTKYDEAFIPPPPECPESFVYGDSVTVPVLMETPSDIPGADNEYSLLVLEGYRTVRGRNRLVRYRMRLDGFASLYSSEEETLVVTREFTYDGDELYANLSTSARGYVRFTLRSKDKEYSTVEIFGNSTDKRIPFIDKSAVKNLRGEPVTLEIELYDADIYSIRFSES